MVYDMTMRGLTTAEVLERRRQAGPNVLPRARTATAGSILLGQFKNPLVYIILGAALVSLVLGEASDFLVIMAVVVLDVALGFFQEYRAQRTYQALKGLLKPTTTVIRDGERQEIEVQELVPGDLAVLASGEHIPGDGQLLQATKLLVDEAILTGESEPIAKTEAAEEAEVYMGTTVVTGHGIMQVAYTGANTELGQIASSLHDTVDEETPLQVRLKAFSATLTRLVGLVTVAIFVAGLMSGRPFLEMLRVSIILAVAAVPEGMLIAVTIILVVGMRKILRRNALVKELLAVETLGSVSVICTDKTGTLTEGRMRVTKTVFTNRQRALEVMVLCNDLEGPVDAALWEYAHAESWDASGLLQRAERADEELFSSETKYMISTNRIDGAELDYLKGAPEIVLDMCKLEAEDRRQIMHDVEASAAEGLRLLGLAYRSRAALADHNGYTWVGLLALEDPVREGVVESIRTAQRAGIQVKMITGDYRTTAERVAAVVGLSVSGDQIMEGDELTALSDEELVSCVKHVTVFSRIRPQDKLRIVRALQANNEVCAMIGDGVNDAPALKRANIGVVVGSAADVAKETADLILLDSNFKTVVAAVEEGRVIFENIRKVVAYMLSNSFAEVLLIFGAMVLGWPAPLSVAQILWVHLICDGPSDIVLGLEPKEPGIMEEKPRSLSEPILSRLGLYLIGVISVSSALVGLGLFGHYFQTHGSAVAGRSFAYASLAANSMVYIFAYRSMRRPLWRSGPLSQNPLLIVSVALGLGLAVVPFMVPQLQKLLGIVPLTAEQWVLVWGVALSLLAVVEIGKWASRRLRFAQVAPAAGRQPSS
jgi:Ca2+-transporting ATPase